MGGDLRSFWIHTNALVAGGLPKSVFGAVVKRESRFYGYNLKRVRPSDAVRLFETLRPMTLFVALFRAEKTIVGTRTYSWAAINPYNNFITFYRLELFPESIKFNIRWCLIVFVIWFTRNAIFKSQLYLFTDNLSCLEAYV